MQGLNVTLPVRASYGVLIFMCLNQPEFEVFKPSEEMEDVSDSPYLEGVLPADRTVVYWVDTMIFRLSAEEL